MRGGKGQGGERSERMKRRHDHIILCSHQAFLAVDKEIVK